MSDGVTIARSENASVKTTAVEPEQPKSSRNSALRLVAALTIAIVLSSSASHALVRWLKIETKTGKAWAVGRASGKQMAFVAGSSLAGDAISWSRVAALLDQPVGGWGVAGASPYELEVFQQKMGPAGTTFIVVSAYDLNESSLSDFRADVVPVSHTIKELAASRASWPFSKRVVSQYLVRWLRVVFPTIGRSRGTMGELRNKAGELLGRREKAAEAGPSLAFGESNTEKAYKNERISNWSQATVTRKLDAMRTAFLGEQSFDGLKHRALKRMVARAAEGGRAFVVVLPVSPVYAERFLTPVVRQEFEQSLADVQSAVPGAQWIRMDQIKELQTNENFWDLVHMNGAGQQIATERMIAALGQGDRK